MRKRISNMVALIIALFFLGACGGGNVKVKQTSMSENPTEQIEQINHLDSDLKNARNNQIDVLSPKWFAKAEESFNNAIKESNRDAALSDILKNVDQSREELKRAEDFAQVASTSLSKVINQRELARASGATKMGKDYVKAEGKFLDLMRSVEKNNLKSARKNEAKVINSFRQLELRAIKEQTLGEIRKLLKQAKKEKAKKFAPASYALATNKLEAADAFISKHPYEKEQMLEKANDALFEAWRCVRVTRQSKKVKTMKPEQITLWYEKALYQTAGALSAPDMRDKPFENQVENILSSITALKNERNSKVDTMKEQQAEIDALKEQTASLADRTRKEQAEKERLAAEKKFNELFGEVRTLFNANEAEVYKQGNQLLIRLGAIEFPVGKYVIMQTNYGLLSKVQLAIRIFDEPDVVVEGHTDSTGSDELNQHLSEKRAHAVGQYLIANQTLAADRIETVGYGAVRPLASNKTTKGRAVNRRIDIIIKPQSMSQ